MTSSRALELADLNTDNVPTVVMGLREINSPVFIDSRTLPELWRAFEDHRRHRRSGCDRKNPHAPGPACALATAEQQELLVKIMKRMMSVLILFASRQIDRQMSAFENDE